MQYGTMRRIAEEVEFDAVEIQQALLAALEESATVINDLTSASAASLRDFGDRMLTFADIYQTRLGNVANSLPNSAEAQSLLADAQQMRQRIDMVRNAGEEAMAQYGRQIADAIQAGRVGAIADAGGAAITAVEIGSAFASASQTGDWRSVGEEVGGWVFGAAAGSAGAAAATALAVALGLTAGPLTAFVLLGAFVGSYFGSTFGKPLGGLSFDGWRSIVNGLAGFFEDAENTVSPLVLDLDGDGIETVSVKRGAHFDLDAVSGWSF